MKNYKMLLNLCQKWYKIKYSTLSGKILGGLFYHKKISQNGMKVYRFGWQTKSPQGR
jgi:hypothetical protein